MLFLTGQTQTTCSSMLQGTSRSIHGTLTTPQAEVWCGTHLDMGGAAWNDSNLVKHQTTRGAKLVLKNFIQTIPTLYLLHLHYLTLCYVCIQTVDQIIWTFLENTEMSKLVLQFFPCSVVGNCGKMDEMDKLFDKFAFCTLYHILMWSCHFECYSDTWPCRLLSTNLTEESFFCRKSPSGKEGGEMKS